MRKISIVRILLVPYMLLTAPTIRELQNLDMVNLIDMLAEQTAFYTKYLKEIGFSNESEAYRQLIVDIQAAIQIKQKEKADSPTVVAVKNFNSLKKFLIK